MYNLYPNLPNAEKLEKLDDQVVCRHSKPPPPYIPPAEPDVVPEQPIDETHALDQQYPGDFLGPQPSGLFHPSAPPPPPLPWPAAPAIYNQPPPHTDPYAPAQRTAGMGGEASNTRSAKTYKTEVISITENRTDVLPLIEMPNPREKCILVRATTEDITFCAETHVGVGDRSAG